jgi:hypothetical protein
MATKLIFANLESQTWTAESGASINSVLPEALAAANDPDGSLRFTNVSTADFGGGLITLKLPWPTIPGIALPYFGLDFQVFVSPQDLPFLARLECDIKAVQTPAPNAETPIDNVMNWSNQWSQPDGNWQTTNAAGAWVDSGYVPGVIPAGVWVPISLRFKQNADGTYSYTSVAVNAPPAPFLIPTAELALQSSNWDAVIAVQFQTEVAEIGAVNVSYRGITVTLSDTAF